MEKERPPELLSSEVMSGAYTQDYQPIYPDEQRLQDAAAELEGIEAVTTPTDIDSLRVDLAKTAAGKDERPVVIVGPCAEPVNLRDSIQDLAADYKSAVDIVETHTHNPLAISRSRGQSAKPRSEQYSTLPDGGKVPSYYGDMINGVSVEDRTPDPSRMIATAVQSRDIETELARMSDRHIPAAHEALLLPYEQAFLRQDESTGKSYLLSADLPWIGERTNGPDGKHVELLAQAENPIGIKLGPSATPEQIAALSEQLNVGDEPGKLVFMPRLGLSEMELLPDMLRAVKEYAPDSLIVCDPMHGNTKQVQLPRGGKVKTRYVDDIIGEIRIVAKACQEQGLRLSGIHLEASGRDDHEECVDEPGQVPRDKSVVDPQLNNTQLKRVLRETGGLYGK